VFKQTEIPYFCPLPKFVPEIKQRHTERKLSMFTEFWSESDVAANGTT
jgi:hypothetical protein